MLGWGGGGEGEGGSGRDILFHFQQPHKEVLCWAQEGVVSFVRLESLNLIPYFRPKRIIKEN